MAIRLVATLASALCVLMTLAPGVGRAQCTPQEAAILTASDAAASDRLGSAVAVSGDTAVVGAPLEGSGALVPGAAYVFARDHGGPNAWGEVAKLTASDGASGDQFGAAVAVSGDTVLVGAYLHDAVGTFSGAAYVFQRDQGGPGAWGEVLRLAPLDPNAGDAFGLSVALSGDAALVGARNDDDNGAESGSAYLFERDLGGANAWGQSAKLTASDGAAGDWFGQSVALEGERAAVGAVRAAGSGAAYVYERDQGGAGSWGEVSKLVASDGAAGDQFGFTVAVSGDTVAAGADADDDGGADSGSAYVFGRDQGGVGNWGQVAKLTALDASAGDRFGRVALSGDVALIGALDSGAGGAFYTFGRDQGGADRWGQMSRTEASSGAAADQFGHAVALSGALALVGAPLDDAHGSAAGAAYVFDRISVQPDPLEVARLTGNQAIHDNFGGAVAVDADTVVAGAWSDDELGTAAGAVYVFERDEGGPGQWGQKRKLTASDGTVWQTFGDAVALDRDTLLVGASQDDTNGDRAGAAYVFERDLGGEDSWGEVVKLLPSSWAVRGYFGYAVAISGDTALVGALGEGAGAVYVFERHFGGVENWGESKRVVASDGVGGDQFGFSLDLDGDTALVGSVDADAAYVLERDLGGVGAWGERAILHGSGFSAAGLFGWSVALSGDTGLVSAPHDDDQGVSSGSVFVFERGQGGANSWGQVTKLLAPNGSAGDRFGNAVAIFGDAAAVGSSGNTRPLHLFWRDQGAAGAWGEAARFLPAGVIAADEFGRSVSVSGRTGVAGTKFADIAFVFEPVLAVPPTTYCTAGVSFSGCQARIGASGTPSATAASGFDLIATGVEGDKNGLFFFGATGRQASSWGNGSSLQCVVPPVKRGALISGGGAVGTCDGVFVHDLNARWSSNPNQNPGAGALVQAQLWYRDPFNTSNQSTSLSDALEFSVCP